MTVFRPLGVVNSVLPVFSSMRYLPGCKLQWQIKCFEAWKSHPHSQADDGADGTRCRCKKCTKIFFSCTNLNCQWAFRLDQVCVSVQSCFDSRAAWATMGLRSCFPAPCNSPCNLQFVCRMFLDQLIPSVLQGFIISQLRQILSIHFYPGRATGKWRQIPCSFSIMGNAHETFWISGVSTAVHEPRFK